jgi:hypothetical protein
MKFSAKHELIELMKIGKPLSMIKAVHSSYPRNFANGEIQECSEIVGTYRKVFNELMDGNELSSDEKNKMYELADLYELTSLI